MLRRFIQKIRANNRIAELCDKVEKLEKSRRGNPDFVRNAYNEVRNLAREHNIDVSEDLSYLENQLKQAYSKEAGYHESRIKSRLKVIRDGKGSEYFAARAGNAFQTDSIVDEEGVCHQRTKDGKFVPIYLIKSVFDQINPKEFKVILNANNPFRIQEKENGDQELVAIEGLNSIKTPRFKKVAEGHNRELVDREYDDSGKVVAVFKKTGENENGKSDYELDSFNEDYNIVIAEGKIRGVIKKVRACQVGERENLFVGENGRLYGAKHNNNLDCFIAYPMESSKGMTASWNQDSDDKAYGIAQDGGDVEAFDSYVEQMVQSFMPDKRSDLVKRLDKETQEARKNEREKAYREREDQKKTKSYKQAKELEIAVA